MGLTITRDLDVISIGVPPVIHLSQYDDDFSLVFNLYASSGTVTLPTGTTAEIMGTKRDGNGYSAEATVSGTSVTVAGNKQMTACAGRNIFELATKYNNKKLYTANFIIDVERAALDAGTIRSDTVLEELDAIIDGANRAEAAASEAQGYASDAAASAAQIENGMYPNFTAGNALQLISDTYTTNSIPYLYRQTPSGAGNREIDEIVGGSVGWNQLAQSLSSTGTSNNITFTKNNDGSWTISGTPDSNNAFRNLDYEANKNYLLKDHVYYLPKGTSDSQEIGLGLAAGSMISSYENPHDELIKITATQASANASWMRLQVSNMANIQIQGTVKVYPQLYDITQMLGATIADYIYTLESGTAGSGIAKLKEWGFFCKDYYPYNAGSLESVKTSGKVTVGKNLLPKATGTTTNSGVSFVPLSDGSVLANGTSTSNQTQRLINFSVPFTGNYYFDGCATGGGSGTYDVYIWDNGASSRAKRWDGTTNSSSDYGDGSVAVRLVAGVEYTYVIRIVNGYTVNNVLFKPMIRLATADATWQPYTKNTYPLDSTLTLRGIFKKDANNNLYADGDVYKSDGTVVRKYGVLTGQTKAVGATITLTGAQSNLTDLVSSAGHLDEIGTISGTTLTLTKALTNAVIVYPLATPTTETADPYTPIQICDPNGTEEYIDTRDVPVPVGHNTKYPANLREKLDTIPALPTSAGSYRLKVTVSGGVPSYEWTTS